MAAKVCPHCRYSFSLGMSRGVIVAIAVSAILLVGSIGGFVWKQRADDEREACQGTAMYEKAFGLTPRKC
jgi:hypothetical protein